MSLFAMSSYFVCVSIFALKAYLKSLSLLIFYLFV